MIRLDPAPPPWHRRARRWATRRRRLLAAGLVTVAVWSAGTTAVSTLRPATVPVVVAARELPAGTRLSPDDVRTVDWPADLAPDGLVGAAEGTVATSALLRGEPLTGARVRGTANPTAELAVAGRATVLVGLADAWASHLVQPGTTVDVYIPATGWGPEAAGAATATRAATGAVVLDTIGSGSPRGPGTGLGSSWDVADVAEPPAAALVLAVRPAEAPSLAATAGTGVAVTIPAADDAGGSAVPNRERVG